MLHAEQRDAAAVALLGCAVLAPQRSVRYCVQNRYNAAQVGKITKPNCLTSRLKKRDAHGTRPR